MEKYDELTKNNAAKRLMDHILSKGVTQAEIAKKSGLTENTISLIINGSKPQAITVYKLNSYLKSFHNEG